MIERSGERDAALAAMLPHVPEHGWTRRSLRAGLRDRGAAEADAEFLFLDTADMVAAYIDYADRRMAAAAGCVAGLGLTGRVRGLILLRLAQAEAEREAVRRAMAVLALPRHAGVAARSLTQTVDAIWRAAGERATDFSWYTKRAILAGVYAATLLYWLRQAGLDDPDNAATAAFLDRRLAMVGRIGKLRRRWLPPRPGTPAAA